MTLTAAMILLAAASNAPLTQAALLTSGAVQFSSGRLSFQWPSSGFTVRFSGSLLSGDLEDSASGKPSVHGGTESNSLEVRVDGGPGRPLTLRPGRNHVLLAEGLTAGPHIVSVRKRTESHVGVVTVHGLEAPGGLQKPPVQGRRLTVYGDSNSCGYGVEATSREVRYSPSTQNSEAAFPAIAARALGLELDLIAASGWGIMRGYGGDESHSVPRVWNRIFIDKPMPLQEGPEPAAIVVVLGDNDFAQGDPGPAFDAAYLEFVKELRKKHRSSPILLCVSSFMQGDGPKKRVKAVIEGITASLKDPQIFRVTLPAYQESWGYGADWHMSLRGQRQAAEPLINLLEGMRVARRVGSGE